MTQTPRTYVIDTLATTHNYPIHFTDDTPLFASYGTMIDVGGVEHMRVPDGWVDAFGGRLTNEEMKDYLIDHIDESLIVYNPYPTRTRI